MASHGRPRPVDSIPLGDRGDHDGLLEGEDPAACAAEVVAEEVLSILQAVDARTSEMDATARREADEIRRAADLAAADAVARYAATVRELDALATELDERAATRGYGD
jgi:hypothetical protein